MLGAWIPNIQIQNPFKKLNKWKIGIQMVRFWNGQDFSYSYALELAIQKQNQYLRIQDGIQKSPNHNNAFPWSL